MPQPPSDNILTTVTPSSVTHGTSLQKYLELYDEYLKRMIRWSERLVLTAGEYMHLHEQDIHSGGSYRMWENLAAYVHHLDTYVHRFKKMIFCHSWEKQSHLAANQCKREQFFYYELNNLTAPQLRDSDFHFPLSQEQSARHPSGSWRMDPIPIEPCLGDLLAKVDWFQTYILGYSAETDEFYCHNYLLPATSENIQHAVRAYVDTKVCAYQFTIYGYTLNDKTHLFTDADLAFLRHVFLMHIVAWNFELRSADDARKYLLTPLEKARSAWESGRQQLDLLREAVQEAISHIETVATKGIADSVRSLILPIEPWLNRYLFDEPHKLPNFLAQANTEFPSFWKKVEATHQRDSRALLIDFGKICGVQEYHLAKDNLELAFAETWATGIWFAYKLLTRRLADADRSGLLGPDQLLLALLTGLAPPRGRERNTKVTVNVTYQGHGCHDAIDFAQTCAIALPTAETPFWPKCAWRIEVVPVETRSAFAAKWQFSSSGDSSPLISYLQAGLMRVEEEPRMGVLVLVPKPSSEGSNSCGKLLFHLSNLVEEMAYPENSGCVCLTGIDVLYEVFKHAGRGRQCFARTTIALACEGAIDAIQQLTAGLKGADDEGELGQAWNGLLSCLNQPNRGFKDDGRWAPGLAIREVDSKSINLVVRLESRREEF